MHPGAANLTMLHSHGLVRGAVEVARGLYYGGDLQHAAELVRCGDAAAVDFSFYRGRVDWQPGELRLSCALAPAPNLLRGATAQCAGFRALGEPRLRGEAAAGATEARSVPSGGLHVCEVPECYMGLVQIECTR